MNWRLTVATLAAITVSLAPAGGCPAPGNPAEGPGAGERDLGIVISVDYAGGTVTTETGTYEVGILGVAGCRSGRRLVEVSGLYTCT